MRAIDRKLTRDLLRLRMQVLAIALIIGSGVALIIMSLASIEALDETTVAYYERYRFADVFATVKRAPERLVTRIAAISGVRSVDTRIKELAIVDIARVAEPVLATFVSLPERGIADLNRLAIRQGRSVTPGRSDEIVVSEPFAEAHGLAPGDRIEAILNGRKRVLDIVGIALSPEYIYAIGPGSLMPDDVHYGIIWMARDALAAAFDLDGAFNDVSLALLPDALAPEVIARLDTILGPYGGIGAYERADQISNWFVMNEIEQLRNMVRILPTIFLAVAAFLTNMVLTRLIATERAEIGLLKAFGFTNAAVGWHYAKMAIAIALVGIAVGSVTGYFLGRYNVEIYSGFFRFPFLVYRPGPDSFAIAGLISLAAALAGTWNSVRQAVSLPPAEAMRPPAPPLYRRAGAIGTVTSRWFDQPTRIILRQLVRWPMRSLGTSFGIAMSVAVLVTSLQWQDSIEEMLDFYFKRTQHQDITVGLVEAQSADVIGDLANLPGVNHAEGVRVVAVRFRAGARSHRESIQGILPDVTLTTIRDVDGGRIEVPEQGLLMSETLAEILDVRRGDFVDVEILEGRRPTLRLPVSALFDTYIGTPSYLHLDTLNRLLLEPRAVNLGYLQVDPLATPAFYEAIKDRPKLSALTTRQAAIDAFHDTLGETLLIYTTFFVAFSCVLAFGVAYNSARIALSERGRELATLRVLGFGRREISYILLGEITILTFVALPVGCAAGFGLVWLSALVFKTELFRIPMVVLPSTFGTAMVVGMAATLASAALVRRRLHRLDLIAVLKTRE